MADDLLNPPGRPCRCGSGPCDRASAWTDPGQIATALRRDAISRRIEALRSRFHQDAVERLIHHTQQQKDAS